MEHYILKITLLIVSIIGFLTSGIITEYFLHYIVACLNLVVLILCVKQHKMSK